MIVKKIKREQFNGTVEGTHNRTYTIRRKIRYYKDDIGSWVVSIPIEIYMRSAEQWHLFFANWHHKQFFVPDKSGKAGCYDRVTFTLFEKKSKPSNYYYNYVVKLPQNLTPA